MSLHKLSEIRGLNDPLKQFQVSFTISMTPALTLAIGQQKIASVLNGNYGTVTAKELELRCTSFSYPGTKINQSTTIIAGHIRRLATNQDKSGTWKCKVTEDQQGGVLNTIQAWCDLIHNQFTGVRTSSSVYVASCVVEIKGEGNNKRKLWLKGFYPISYSVNDINTSESSPVEVDITFNYDWWSETISSGLSLGVLL